MFIAALFTITKAWKQYKYPLTDEYMYFILRHGTYIQWNAIHP